MPAAGSWPLGGRYPFREPFSERPFYSRPREFGELVLSTHNGRSTARLAVTLTGQSGRTFSGRNPADAACGPDPRPIT
jgi:hypothetical protein